MSTKLRLNSTIALEKLSKETYVVEITGEHIDDYREIFISRKKLGGFLYTEKTADSKRTLDSLQVRVAIPGYLFTFIQEDLEFGHDL